MARVICVIRQYPQLNQTYVETERREIEKFAQTLVFSSQRPKFPTPEHLPFRQVPEKNRLMIKWNAWRFRPDVVHAHFMSMAKHASDVARTIKVPWTLRTHSSDLLAYSLEKISEYAKYCNQDDCLAVLAFPFLRARLLEAGLKEEKIIDTMPVVDTSLFPFVENHGSSIINLGLMATKKNMEDFIRLSKLRRDLNFNLYPMGSSKKIDGFRQLARRQDGNVEIRDPVRFSKMPEVWREHGWLVYTADKQLKSVGWPLAVVEAWASGTGVCVPRIRPDIEQYVGNAAIVYDDIEEVAELIGEPPDSDLLERGKRRAAEMDIKNWINPLFETWRQAGVPI